jgi:hypothetical protein
MFDRYVGRCARARQNFHRLAKAAAVEKLNERDRIAALGTAATTIENAFAQIHGKPIRSAAARTGPRAIKPAAAKCDAATGQHVPETDGASALD